MKKIFGLFLALLSVNAFAGGFVCNEDMRNRGGTYQELHLMQTGETYDLVYRHANMNDPLATETKLATGLTCETASSDNRLVKCLGQNGFWFNTSKTMVVQLSSSSEAGATSKNTYFDLDVRAPRSDAVKTKYRFMYSDCKAL